MPCLFCSILQSGKAHVVYEDDHAFAVLDIAPRAPGHTMVIPKVHAANMLELPDAEIGPLFVAVKNATARLERALHPDGFTIGINHGRMAGQFVEHLHIHIIPRFVNDGGTSLHAIVENPPKESLESFTEKIKKAI